MSTFTTNFHLEKPETGAQTGWDEAWRDAMDTIDGTLKNHADDLASAAVLPIAQSDVSGLAATLATKAPLASPALTGTPTAPTAGLDTNTTQIATAAFVLAQAGSASPIIDGSAAVGISLRYARQDHVHPTDTSRAASTHTHAESDVTNLVSDLAAKAPLASPTFTGTPAAPTAAVDTNTTQVATTAYVVAQAASATPQAPGTAAVGTSTRYARADHVHSSGVLALTTAGTGYLINTHHMPAAVATLNAASDNIASNNQIRYQRIILREFFTVRKVAVNVATARVGRNGGVALYSVDGTTKLMDSGNLLHTTLGPITATLGAAVPLTPGEYLLCFSADSTSSAIAGLAYSAAQSTSGVFDAINSVTTYMGTAANAWSNSTGFPSSLGALTNFTNLAGSGFGWPILILVG